MLNTPFSPWPSYTEEEMSAVAGVLKSNEVNYWTGEQTRQFEKEFAGAVGAKHAVALCNGTVALDMALRFMVQPGDDVVVTPRTFLASVSSIIGAGCRPIFADVDRDTQNITAETIAAVLTAKTKAIVVVHLAGMPADMDPIMDLAAEHGIKVIEDCAQAHGARYKGRSVGTIGDVGAWSFCQDKIMTTGGEGGMVTINDDSLWSAMWSYKDHGKSWTAIHDRPDGTGFKWVHDSFGTNWRMTEMQGAIGRIQLKRLSEWQATRWQHGARIWRTCEGMKWLRVLSVPDEIAHAMYKTYVFINPDQLPPAWHRDRLLDEISQQGVPVYSGSCPEVYLEKAFDNTDFRPAERLPVARELGEQSLMFLCHPTLTESEIDQTCAAIERVGSLIQAEQPSLKAIC